MNKTEQYRDLVRARVENLKGLVANKATAFVHSGSTSDQREAKEAIVELRAWREAETHFNAIFETTDGR